MIKKSTTPNETTTDGIDTNDVSKNISVDEVTASEIESKPEKIVKPRTRRKIVEAEIVEIQPNDIKEEATVVIELTNSEDTEIMKDSDKEKTKKVLSKEKAKKKAKAKKDKQKEKDKENKKKAKKREKVKKQKAKDKAKAKKKEKAKKKSKSKKKK